MIQTTWVALKPLLFVFAGGYAGISILMYLTQSRFIYHPRSGLSGTPSDIGIAFEDVTITTEDHVAIHGWFVPADRPRCTMLFCHGNTGNISDRLGMIEVYHRLRMNVLIYDYRGYGKSGGVPTEQGTYRDAEAVWKHLTETRGIDPAGIVIWGRSLGGAVAARLARDHRPGALVLESAFTSLTDMGKALHPWLPVRLLLRFTYPTVEYLRGVRRPVLVIHSPEDDLVPPEHGRELFAAASEPKEFLEISGGHNRGNLDSGDRYSDGIDRFIGKLYGE